MRKLIFIIPFLFIGVGLNSCKKCIKLNDAWGATLNKTEVIKGLKTQGLPKKELAKLEKEMPDEVQYFVGNNKGNWEEYLQVSEKRFDRIAGADRKSVV